VLIQHGKPYTMPLITAFIIYDILGWSFLGVFGRDRIPRHTRSVAGLAPEPVTQQVHATNASDRNELSEDTLKKSAPMHYQLK
jgi:hypothetical protein